MDKTQKEILHLVGSKHNISDKEAKLIFETVFELVKNTMESGDREKLFFENVMLQNFGKFYSNKYIVPHMERNRKRKEERNEQANKNV